MVIYHLAPFSLIFDDKRLILGKIEGVETGLSSFGNQIIWNPADNFVMVLKSRQCFTLCDVELNIALQSLEIEGINDI